MKRKTVPLLLLLYALMLISAVSFADHSRDCEKATELYVEGDYDSTHTAFMAIDSTELFE